MKDLDLKTKRSLAMLVLALLTANSIPVLATALNPILGTKIPIPMVETIGGIIGLAGIVVLYWLWNKDF
jgi:hypothetical protein